MVNMSKGSAMTKAMSIMQYDAMGIGEIDFGIGWESVKNLMEETDFPFLSANIVKTVDGSQEFFAKPYITLDIGNGEKAEKVAVIALSNPANFNKMARFKIDDLKTLEPVEALEPVLGEVLENTERIICLSNLTRELEVEVANRYPEIDIIIGAKAPFFSNQPVYIKGGETINLGFEGERLKGGTLIVSGMDKGRGLGMLNVVLDSDGDIEKFRFELIGINLKEYQEDPQSKALLLSYDNDMKKDDAQAAVEEYTELIKNDYSHLRNLNTIMEIGEEGKQAFNRGEYAKALELLTSARDSLSVREVAKEKWDLLEEDLQRGIPEGLPTNKLFTIMEEAKKLYNERYFQKAKKTFTEAHMALNRLRKIDEYQQKYLDEKDLLKEEGIDLTMSDKARKALEKAIKEEKYRDALGIIQRANMKIRQAKNVIKWRNISERLLGDVGDEALKDSAIASAISKADSAYTQGDFVQARKAYDRLVKMLEPLTDTGSPLPVKGASAHTSPENRYVGSQECKSCHEEEYKHWSVTHHAKALDRLDLESRSDPECIRCHVVGYGSEDGYKIGESNPGLGGVGCESCHGRGYLHTLSDERASIDPGHEVSKCTVCHDKNQGFYFDYFPSLVSVLHK